MECSGGGSSFKLVRQILLHSMTILNVWKTLGKRLNCANHNQHVRHANARVCGGMSPGIFKKIDALRLNLRPHIELMNYKIYMHALIYFKP